jgi:hypothetical protein
LNSRNISRTAQDTVTLHSDRNPLVRLISSCQQSVKRPFISLIPFSLLFLHTVAFLCIFPLLDLPVADDANYFGYAKQFARDRISLYADWTPALTYMGALLHWCLPFSWYMLYAVYCYICKLFLIIGTHSFIVHFTRDKYWAFFNTIIISICFSYWMQNNGRAFANGCMLLLIPLIAKEKNISIYSIAGWIMLSMLLRVEYIILTIGFCIITIFSYSKFGLSNLFRPTRRSLFLLGISILLWIPICFMGKTSTNRLEFAFAQEFRDYVIQHQIDSQKMDQPSHDWNEVIQQYFPKEQRDSTSILSKVIPLYEIASANPILMLKFVLHNLHPFITADFRFTQSLWLSKLINFYVIGSFLVFLYGFRNKPIHDKKTLIIISALFVISVFPCLVTRPFRDYVYPAVLWFTCILPFFVFSTPKFRISVISTGLVLTLIFQTPVWIQSFQSHQNMTNWKRAQLIDSVSNREPTISTISEAYPIFSVAFSNNIKKSVHYPVELDSAGVFHAKHQSGPVIHAVVLEKKPPPHLSFQTKQLRNTLSEIGSLIEENNLYAIWKTQSNYIPTPQSMTVTPIQTKIPPVNKKTPIDGILLRWDLETKNSKEFHLYVSVNNAKYQYLSRTTTPKQTLYIWKKNGANITPEYRMGPIEKNIYSFRVYAVPQDQTQNPDFVTSVKIQFPQ